MQTSTAFRSNSEKSIAGLVGARTREATRQVCRRHEYQLIGAITKRPN